MSGTHDSDEDEPRHALLTATGAAATLPDMQRVETRMFTHSHSDSQPHAVNTVMWVPVRSAEESAAVANAAKSGVSADGVAAAVHALYGEGALL
jgi:hypothetical protein